jgi:hypothetical protein
LFSPQKQPMSTLDTVMRMVERSTAGRAARGSLIAALSATRIWRPFGGAGAVAMGENARLRDVSYSCRQK